MTHYRAVLILGLQMLGAVFLSAASDSVCQRPNIIVILTDDQGYADAGFQGFPRSEEVLTPSIDRLASEGVAFRNGYVAFSTCGPSRASLLTGRSSSRFGMEGNKNMDDGDTGPPLSEIIIPAAIKGSGYVTGAVGKWHLGSKKEERRPIARGFDYYWGDLAAEKDYLMTRTEDPPSWKSGEASPRDYGRYLTDAYTDEAVSFIRRNKDQPFFLYVAYNAPHSPFRTYEPLVKRIVEHAPQYQGAYERMLTHTTLKKQQPYYHAPAFDFGKFKGKDLDQELLRLTYLSMLLAADDGVGNIMETLDREGLREDTLVFYLSDNGAALARPNDLGGVNLPLRSGKGSEYEGGVRVPYVMSWPGVLPQGVVNTKDVVSSMDIFTTTVALAGAELPRDRIIDGVNLMPYLTGEKEGNPHEVLFFRRQVRNANAIRVGDYKWIDYAARPKDLTQLGAKAEPWLDAGALYNVQEDISEYHDLSTEMPEKKKELIALYTKLNRDLPVNEDRAAKLEDDDG